MPDRRNRLIRRSGNAIHRSAHTLSEFLGERSHRGPRRAKVVRVENAPNEGGSDDHAVGISGDTCCLVTAGDPQTDPDGRLACDLGRARRVQGRRY